MLLSTPFVCRRCLLRHVSRGQQSSNALKRRWISQKFLKKQADAEERWQAQAKLIKTGQKQSMLSLLEERGYIDKVAGHRDALDKLLTTKRVGAYVGVDPTAPSIHIGNLLPLMTLFWMYVHGYHVVSVLGGATAKVGDPTGRTKSREKEHSTVRKAYMVGMHYQLKKLWANVEQYGRKYGYEWEWAWHRELVNNNTWLNKLSVMELMQVLGPGMRLGTMMGKETVRTKMEKGDGMSYAEFSYPVLQAWDWWYMYKTKRIQLQVGGSDQLGNIVAGIDAVKYISKTYHDENYRQTGDDPTMAPSGFTVPLLTTSSGEKFGKSAGNAIWLDKEMTSSFDLYQFFLRCADADVGRYLKLFTFMPIPEIDKIVAEHAVDPAQRKGQHALAREFVELVHGESDAIDAENQHRSIFRQSPVLMAARELTKPGASLSDEKGGKGTTPITAANAPPMQVTLPESLVIGATIPRLLHSSGLVESRTAGQKLAAARGAYIGSRAEGGGAMRDAVEFTQAKLWDASRTKEYLLDGRLLILRAGKWRVKIVRMVSDDEYERLGLNAPGWDEVLQRREAGRGGSGEAAKMDHSEPPPRPIRKILS
ncbi:MAG: tyrosyl-tRNA synthetase [Caeruleum heppii]|nr:MAG: tyrosyl-tRNA synthetase [Caeruleum heppii]